MMKHYANVLDADTARSDIACRDERYDEAYFEKLYRTPVRLTGGLAPAASAGPRLPAHADEEIAAAAPVWLTDSRPQRPTGKENASCLRCRGGCYVYWGRYQGSTELWCSNGRMLAKWEPPRRRRRPQPVVDDGPATPEQVARAALERLAEGGSISDPTALRRALSATDIDLMPHMLTA